VVLDFRNTTRGELIAGLAGVALFVIMLAFDWYGIKAHLVDVTIERGTHNAFQAFTVIDLVLLLTALAAVALPLWSALGWPATGPIRPATGPIRPGAIVGALGGLAFVLIAFRLIDLPDLAIPIAPEVQSDFPEPVHLSDFPDDTYEATRKVGPWLGLAASALIAYGGYLSMRHPVSAPGEDAPLPPREPLETA
jgi:hypothetical protein